MEFEFNEQNIINLVARHQSSICTSFDVLIPNCYTSHDNEADLLAIRKSGMCDEFEIKISRADFFNDAKKTVQYRSCEWDGIDEQFLAENNDYIKTGIIAPWQKPKYESLVDGDMTANYFWYVIKEGIVELDEIPDFAGVFFVDDNGELSRARTAKRLHRNKLSYEERFRLCRKLGFRFWDYRLGLR